MSLTPPWSISRKITFRFFFIFFILVSAFWTLLPGVGNWLATYTYHPSFFVQNYILNLHNPHKWFHTPTGSGDTLDDWILVLTYLFISVIISLIWTALDKKHQHHERLRNWLSIGLRYYLAYVLFGYGIQKLFVLQMPYPSLAQLYTPLGDFTPMRFAWMFVGYSPGYQFISGLLETIGAFLILFRRTQLIGLLVLIGVMSHVVMLNFFYGIPVKYFSSFLLLITIYLTSPFAHRLFSFLLGRAVDSESVYVIEGGKWVSLLRTITKISFIIYAVGFTTYESYSWSKMMSAIPKPEIYGAFDVYEFKRNGMDVNSPVDTTRWNQVIVSDGFQQGEGRGIIKAGTSKLQLVVFTTDSLKSLTINMRGDTSKLFSGVYKKLDAERFRWLGKIKDDSVSLLLQRNERKFTLASRKFKWVLEHNEF